MHPARMTARQLRSSPRAHTTESVLLKSVSPDVTERVWRRPRPPCLPLAAPRWRGRPTAVAACPRPRFALGLFATHPSRPRRDRARVSVYSTDHTPRRRANRHALSQPPIKHALASPAPLSRLASPPCDHPPLCGAARVLPPLQSSAAAKPPPARARGLPAWRTAIAQASGPPHTAKPPPAFSLSSGEMASRSCRDGAEIMPSSLTRDDGPELILPRHVWQVDLDPRLGLVARLEILLALP